MIENEFQLVNTQRKLALLEDHIAKRRAAFDYGPVSDADELSLRSLTQTANQLKEEILRYEAKRKKEAAAASGE